MRAAEQPRVFNGVRGPEEIETKGFSQDAVQTVVFFWPSCPCALVHTNSSPVFMDRNCLLFTKYNVDAQNELGKSDILVRLQHAL